MAAKAFFDKLPIGTLVEDEVLLVDLLEQISEVVQRFLPRAINLQTWAETRVPPDKVEAINGTGLIYIAGTTSQAETERRGGFKNSCTAAQLNGHAERACGITNSFSSVPKGKGTGDGGFSKPSSSGPKGKGDRKGGVISPRVVAPPKGKGERKGSVASSASSVTPWQTPSTEPDAAAEQITFFNDLPADDFLPEELDLRRKLVVILNRPNRPSPTGGGSHSFRQIEKLPVIIDSLQTLLPPSVSLRLWVERRTAEDFVILDDSEGNPTLSFLRKSDQQMRYTQEEVQDKNAYKEEVQQVQVRSRRKSFLRSLPEDAYTHEENALREALLSFLETWSFHRSPSLDDVGSDRAITHAEKAFLPEGVELAFWIQARMGQELELKKDAKGQHAFGFIGQVILESTESSAGEKRLRGRSQSPAGGKRARGRGPIPGETEEEAEERRARNKTRGRGGQNKQFYDMKYGKAGWG